MRRLLTTIALDMRLQRRNGFYYASAIVAAIWIAMIWALPDVDMARLWPVLILMNLTINTYYFVGGLVLLEKGEGSLEALVVTPLRSEEYLLSKVASLVVLCLAEMLLVVILVQGVWFRWLPLMVGILFMVAMYTLYGFVIVSRYDSVNAWLPPSGVWTIGFSLPLLYYFGLWEHWLFYLHPLLAPMVLIQAAFETIAPWQLVYGLLYSVLCVGLLFWLSRRAFHRFVIAKEGVR